MNAIKQIRTALGMSQTAFAKGIECTQGLIYHYENGLVDPPPRTAAKVIELARVNGLSIGYDHVYGAAEVPPREPVTAEGPVAGQAAGG